MLKGMPSIHTAQHTESFISYKTPKHVCGLGKIQMLPFVDL